MNDHIDDYTDLLGAYALDAVDPEEREDIERHLATCPRCRAEVAEHREVAAFLSQGSPAPEGVWDRIAAELSPPAPPLRMTFSPTGEVDPLATDPKPADDVVVPITSARRGIRIRTFAAAISAAALIIAVLGVVTVNQSRRLDRMESAWNDLSIEVIAGRAGRNAAVDVDLKGSAGTAHAIVDRNGHGFLTTAGLPAPADGSVYQLWGQVDDQILSLGTFGDETTLPFSLDEGRLDDVKAFMVTEEKAPGVASSTQDPVVVGTV